MLDLDPAEIIAAVKADPSFPEIARGLGREAHSAVHGACARVQSLLDADARVDAGPAGEVAVRELTARLRHTLRGTSRG